MLQFDDADFRRNILRVAHEDNVRLFEQRDALEKLRKQIKSAAPEAEECISYGIPSFRIGGTLLVAFGAAAKYCSFYPGALPVETYKDDLEGYSTSNGDHSLSDGQTVAGGIGAEAGQDAGGGAGAEGGGDYSHSQTYSQRSAPLARHFVSVTRAFFPPHISIALRCHPTTVRQS